ncbi:DUF1289 domain-containing protein [Aliiglaciecola sp. M165]|uniref:DUF1289 domain-containing protein n=1 Tax=Aliiglaciecola sp. M165 TaxID=2593649 RepID=UPI0011802820|nr:DUF1289 domain-containing protein [Aliiglaciecola sp. M165]TRY30374.1 DUF1289 domain-containing protein [Aliiglaciecola sp. M165]
MQNESTSIESPCIRNCCLDQNDMCVGCFRMLDEILIWGQASDDKKQAIITKLALRKMTQKSTNAKS